MRKFKSGDRIKCVNSKDWEHFEIGDEVDVLEVLTSSYFVSNKAYISFEFEDDFELVESRTNWHPHADAIIAWAKGEKVQWRRNGEDRWEDVLSPDFDVTFGEWRIKPDNAEEINRIKQEIQTHEKAIDELQAKLKELEA